MWVIDCCPSTHGAIRSPCVFTSRPSWNVLRLLFNSVFAHFAQLFCHWFCVVSFPSSYRSEACGVWWRGGRVIWKCRITTSFKWHNIAIFFPWETFLGGLVIAFDSLNISCLIDYPFESNFDVLSEGYALNTIWCSWLPHKFEGRSDRISVQRAVEYQSGEEKLDVTTRENSYYSAMNCWARLLFLPAFCAHRLHERSRMQMRLETTSGKVMRTSRPQDFQSLEMNI